MRIPQGQGTKDGNTRAFTAIDFLAICGSAAVLSLCAIPALGGRPVATSAAVCLSNHRQLAIAWQMYSAENNGMLVQNYHGGEAQGGTAANNPRNAPWALGWEDWGSISDNTNMLFLRSTKWAKLGPYITASNNIHKCPADRFLSTIQRNKGWNERVRSVSMNATLGDGNQLEGPWNPVYARVKRISDFKNPEPAETMLITDEHPDSINDPLMFAPNINAWVDLPASYHEGAVASSFADGHVELHLWTASARSALIRRSSLLPPPVEAGDADIRWMNYHSARVLPESF